MVSTEHSGYQTADVLNALHDCGNAGEGVERGASSERVVERGGGLALPRRAREEPGHGPGNYGSHRRINPPLERAEGSPTIVKAEEMLLERAGDIDSAVNLAAALSCLRSLGYEPEDLRLTGLVDRLIACQRPDDGWN